MSPGGDPGRSWILDDVECVVLSRGGVYNRCGTSRKVRQMWNGH